MLQTSIENMKRILKKRRYRNIRTVDTIHCGQYQVYRLVALSADIRGSEEVMVLWVTEQGTSVTLYKSMVLYLLQNNLLGSATHLIFITPSISHSCLATIQNHSLYHEIIHFQETLYFMLSHIYVPEYRILSSEEVIEVENKYGDRNQFPKLLYRTDAVARIMDFRPGDIVQVYRTSPTNGTSKFYRQVKLS